MPHNNDTITFIQRKDGVYVAAPWPRYVLIAHELLASNTPGFEVNGDRVIITACNGRAEYVRDMGGNDEADRFRRDSHLFTPMGDQHAA